MLCKPPVRDRLCETRFPRPVPLDRFLQTGSQTGSANRPVPWDRLFETRFPRPVPLDRFLRPVPPDRFRQQTGFLRPVLEDKISKTGSSRPVPQTGSSRPVPRPVPPTDRLFETRFPRPVPLDRFLQQTGSSRPVLTDKFSQTDSSRPVPSTDRFLQTGSANNWKVCELANSWQTHLVRKEVRRKQQEQELRQSSRRYLLTSQLEVNHTA